jgi:hypothetical protein
MLIATTYEQYKNLPHNRGRDTNTLYKEWLFEEQKLLFFADIKKEYYYETEKDDINNPSYEHSELIGLNIKNNSIEIYNNQGDSFLFNKSEIGSSNFKRLENVLKSLIE